MRISDISTPRIQGQHTQTTEDMTRDLEVFNYIKKFTISYGPLRSETERNERIILLEVKRSETKDETQCGDSNKPAQSRNQTALINTRIEERRII